MKNYKISVIIPVYNAEKYLKRCVDSIIRQTYKNLEIILVNDESTDSSLKIIEEYKKQDKRVSIINQKNMGCIMARTTGIKASTGNYVFNVDADDWIEETAIEKLVKYINKYDGVDIVKFGFYTETETIKINDFFVSNSEEIYIDQYLNDEIFNLLMYTSKFHNIWNSIIKREIFDFNSHVYEYMVRKSEDSVINLQLYTKAHSYLIVHDVLYHYNTQANGITNDYRVPKVIRNINDRLYIKNKKEQVALELNKYCNVCLLNEQYFLFIVEQIYYLLRNDDLKGQDLELIQKELNDKEIYNYFKNVDLNQLKYKNIFHNIIAKKVIIKKIKKLYQYKYILKIVLVLLGKNK